ncbi:MAG: hypothetical protein GQ570_15185 [Helicobacteraceae bacterium]|nr:hypothetical protein [Helicobacteraceae bacterium]
MSKTINIFFYKGKGDITDKLIRWWTKSEYSHVELAIGDLFYSTSPRDLKVRSKRITPKFESWDYVTINVTNEQLEDIKLFYKETSNCKYDWLGIFFSQFIKVGVHHKDRWFCSEWVTASLKRAKILEVEYPHNYSPQDLKMLISGSK